MKKVTPKQTANPGEGKTALLVIDVQQGLFQKSTPIYKAEALLQNINLLVERAHRAGVPVIYIQHDDTRGLVKGSPDWQLHPRLQPLPAESLIYKQHPNAFEETNLGEVLQGKGVTRLVVCGMVTHGCVRASCIGALELGYQVALASDAHSSYSPQAAELIEKWNEKLGALNAEVTPSAAITFAD